MVRITYINIVDEELSIYYDGEIQGVHRGCIGGAYRSMPRISVCRGAHRVHTGGSLHIL